MPKRRVCFALLLTVTGASSVLAQDPSAPLARATVEAQVKANFQQVDTNHDGFVSRAEADAARNTAMIAQFNAAFNAMDSNKDGNLSRAEFVAANQKAMAAAMQKQGVADRAFAGSDLNHDGRISLAEALAKPLKEFDAVDANHDGILTLAERQAAAKRRAGK
jgi:Ca2+-binding EF-hand superfamily protein